MRRVLADEESEALRAGLSPEVEEAVDNVAIIELHVIDVPVALRIERAQVQVRVSCT